MRDPYVNASGVLKNRLQIDDYQKLRRAEADIGFVKLINIDAISCDTFDEELIQKIHKHIFEDIYDWAGKYRTVPLVKSELVLPGYSIPYSTPKDVPKDLKERLKEINAISWEDLPKEEIPMLFARKMALLWKVHPFRDGNTRTILSFAYLFAKAHKFPLDMKLFMDNLSRKYREDGDVYRYSVRDKFVLASLDEKDYPEVEALASLVEQAMETYQEERNTHQK